jgi:predicted SAM-dependent methyltransferase
MSPILTLDVGCGNRKMGDINVDISRESKPDVVCDIHFLPFRDSQFKLVYCYHVLEHQGVDPVKAVKELLRVANGTVEIQVPHWLSKNARKDKTHVNFQVMRRKWWLAFHPEAITLDYTRFLLFFARPNNVTVQLRGKRNEV